MAHTKAGGSTNNNRDSQPKYLGVKIYGGQKVQIGSIIVRQRGSKFMPGVGVQKGKDDTLFAMKEGVVQFTDKRKTHFDGNRVMRKLVSVI